MHSPTPRSQSTGKAYWGGFQFALKEVIVDRLWTIVAKAVAAFVRVLSFQWVVYQRDLLSLLGGGYDHFHLVIVSRVPYGGHWWTRSNLIGGKCNCKKTGNIIVSNRSINKDCMFLVNASISSAPIHVAAFVVNTPGQRYLFKDPLFAYSIFVSTASSPHSPGHRNTLFW